MGNSSRRPWRLQGQREVRRVKDVQFLGLLMIPKYNCVPNNPEVKGGGTAWSVKDGNSSFSIHTESQARHRDCACNPVLGKLSQGIREGYWPSLSG